MTKQASAYESRDETISKMIDCRWISGTRGGQKSVKSNNQDDLGGDVSCIYPLTTKVFVSNNHQESTLGRHGHGCDRRFFSSASGAAEACIRPELSSPGQLLGPPI